MTQSDYEVHRKAVGLLPPPSFCPHLSSVIFSVFTAVPVSVTAISGFVTTNAVCMPITASAPTSTAFFTNISLAVSSAEPNNLLCPLSEYPPAKIPPPKLYTDAPETIPLYSLMRCPSIFEQVVVIISKNLFLTRQASSAAFISCSCFSFLRSSSFFLCASISPLVILSISHSGQYFLIIHIFFDESHLFQYESLYSVTR